MNRMEFHLVATQSALDESRAQQDWTRHALHVSQQELEAKTQEVASLKGQIMNLQSINNTLINYTKFLKNQLDAMEATSDGSTQDSQLETHAPDGDDHEMEEDPEEPILVEDE